VGRPRKRAHLILKIHATSFGFARSEKKESQDVFAVKMWDETVIAVIADGVGSARAAREAASRVVETLISSYPARPKTWPPQKALMEFTKLANRTLYQESVARYAATEMVSTLAVAVIEGNKLYGVNVGDSRVYLARNGSMTQLSRDHVADGGSFRHVLEKAVGMDSNIEPFYFEAEIADGDMALICSDGVSNLLNDEELHAKLSHRASARTIVCTAKERATPETMDDISAVVLDIAETGKLKTVSELPLEIPEHLERGRVVDGFELLRPFQHSDRVWLAKKTGDAGDDGQRFTLKFAPLEARDNEEVLHRFVKEIWHATRIDSDFFVRAFVPENATARCYAMEFIEAPSLKSLLRSRRLAIDEAVALGKFLLRASQHLLGAGLVHGDIKPENILVITGYDSIHFKLVDLGSAAEIFSVTSRAGTASYLAPERFHAAPISERTEIFAIGVTLFEALTGAFPHGEIERFQTPHFQRAKNPVHLNPNIPPWFDALLMRSLAVGPELRYQNYSEMLFNLDHPEKVEPFHHAGATWIERDPVRFFKTGFFVLLALVIYLLFKLLSAGVKLP